MWYDASSVITAVEQCKRLVVAPETYPPSCPKKGNNVHCHNDFPECEGKTIKCHQSLRLTNERGDPSILYFDYYVSSNARNGRIKKQNSTLRLLITRYGIDENLMVSL
jgi:hypothetical protein